MSDKPFISDKPLSKPFIAEANKNHPFKSIQGQWLTAGIFEEYQFAKNPLYKLEDLKKLYLDMEDFTEYLFACKYLGGWDHWQAMLESPWFQPHIAKWRTELELKLKAEALSALIDEARIGGKNSYDAKKYLISKGWVDKSAEPSRRGRPSKAEIARNLAEEVFGKDIEQEAVKRLEVN